MKWFGKSTRIRGQTSSKRIFRYGMVCHSVSLAPICTLCYINEMYISILCVCVVIYFGIADRAQNANRLTSDYWRPNRLLCVCYHLCILCGDRQNTRKECACMLQFVFFRLFLPFSNCLFHFFFFLVSFIQSSTSMFHLMCCKQNDMKRIQTHHYVYTSFVYIYICRHNSL